MIFNNRKQELIYGSEGLITLLSLEHFLNNLEQLMPGHENPFSLKQRIPLKLYKHSYHINLISIRYLIPQQ